MSAQRFDSVDALRGAAILWMTAFHFSFDLNHFGWIRQNFYSDPFWTVQRTAIVSLFLFCAGLAQAIASIQGQAPGRFWRRWMQIAGCAALVSVGSLYMFPNSFIHFGVLHGIAFMLVIVRATAGWGQTLWLAGAAAIALKFVGGWLLEPGGPLATLAPVFDSRWLNWLGFISRKPITEDYVPLFPWLGVMWWGVAAGQWLLTSYKAFMAAPLPTVASPLSWLGRWSLSWYMLHQPFLLGLLSAVTALK